MSLSQKEVSLKTHERALCKLAKKEVSLQELRGEYRKLKKENKRLRLSRDAWCTKAKSRGRVVRGMKKRRLGSIREDCPKGHHYPSWLIRLVVCLRVRACCSYGVVCRVLLIIQMELLGLASDEVHVPCANTCQNWVSKVGYYHLEKPDNEMFSEPVCLFIDESIRIGKERLLVILSAPWIYTSSAYTSALSYEEMEVVAMKGSTSWKGEEIASFLRPILSKKEIQVGHIVSDEGSNLKKAIELLGHEHVSDISHALARCLKKTFEPNTDYQAFIRAVGKCQSKLAMGENAYLRPPKPRVKGRFMNQIHTVDWAEVICLKWEQLNEVAQQKLSAIPKYEKIVSQLGHCMEIVKKISKLLKNKGLSNENLKKIKRYLLLQQADDITMTFIKYIQEYLDKYEAFLRKNDFKQQATHVCSDILESIFGCYKSKVSDNYFVGVTGLSLEIPLLCLKKHELTQDIQLICEQIKMTNLKDWRKSQNNDNQHSKRRLFFKK